MLICFQLDQLFTVEGFTDEDLLTHDTENSLQQVVNPKADARMYEQIQIKELPNLYHLRIQLIPKFCLKIFNAFNMYIS